MFEFLLMMTGPVALVIVLMDKMQRQKAAPARSLAAVDLPKNNWPY